MWKLGDKAVCVENMSDGHDISPNGHPVKDRIYLVGGLHFHPDGVGLLISGYPTYDPTGSGRDCGYMAYKFRKIVPQSERKAKEKLFVNAEVSHGDSRCDH